MRRPVGLRSARLPPRSSAATATCQGDTLKIKRQIVRSFVLQSILVFTT